MIKSCIPRFTIMAAKKVMSTNSGRGKYLQNSSIPIHLLSHKPTKAWSEMQVKQRVERVTPLDPSTPISDDKLRFVCLSDTHSRIEGKKEFVPPGDVLLHAGDFTQVGHAQAIDNFNNFIGSLPHKVKIVIAGNHDLTLDTNLVNNRRDYLKDYFNISKTHLEEVLDLLEVKTTRELLTNCHYLLDSCISVCGVNVYGSPWQPEFGDWGFNLPRGEACLEKWNKIPENTDVLVTHGPPIGHGDACYDGNRAGCVELLSTIQRRVKPRYHVFGHIHEGYGVTSDGHTTFINASNCNLRYHLVQPAIVFDVPIPTGHCKAEITEIPVNNLNL